MKRQRFAIRKASGRLWRYRGKTQTFRTARDAQVWLADDTERVVPYKSRRNK